VNNTNLKISQVHVVIKLGSIAFEVGSTFIKGGLASATSRLWFMGKLWGWVGGGRDLANTNNHFCNNMLLIINFGKIVNPKPRMNLVHIYC
jgi:hypothetical protein